MRRRRCDRDGREHRGELEVLETRQHHQVVFENQGAAPAAMYPSARIDEHQL